MKLNICVSTKQELSTHTNMILTEPNFEERLNQVVDNAEATEIIVNDSLEYLVAEEIVIILTAILQKLRKQGEVILTGVDAFSVAQDFAQHIIPIEEFNALIHGSQQRDELQKQTTLTSAGLARFLESEFGLTITEQRFENYHFVIKAQR